MPAEARRRVPLGTARTGLGKVRVELLASRASKALLQESCRNELPRFCRPVPNGKLFVEKSQPGPGPGSAGRVHEPGHANIRHPNTHEALLFSVGPRIKSPGPDYLTKQASPQNKLTVIFRNAISTAPKTQRSSATSPPSSSARLSGASSTDRIVNVLTRARSFLTMLLLSWDRGNGQVVTLQVLGGATVQHTSQKILLHHVDKRYPALLGSGCLRKSIHCHYVSAACPLDIQSSGGSTTFHLGSLWRANIVASPSEEME
ncbi:hypothetical protein B0H12DRAFT_1073698 [Mycena haematopus]|nr:hypothetical protein B0H12DRAFT_1073698 [Mycena haematopus]